MKVVRRAVTAALSLCALVLAAVALAYGFAHLSVMQAPAVLESTAAKRAPTWNEAEYVIVVWRQEERTGANDPLPHRNSPVAIYRKSGLPGAGWSSVRTGLVSRSTSTAEREIENPPEPHIVPGDTCSTGYHSVPFGVYCMTETTWKDGEQCFLLSDWGRSDGIIALRREQTIWRYDAIRDDEGNVLWKETGKSAGDSWEKREVYLHPTFTRQWSRGDSHGCINLYKPRSKDAQASGVPSPPYDWDVFLGWLDQLELRENIAEVPLVVVPLDQWSPNGIAPDSLDASFTANVARVVKEDRSNGQ
jgi:hypothetical protein